MRFSSSAKSIEAEVVFARDRDRGDQASATRGACLLDPNKQEVAFASGGLPSGARADTP